MVETWPRRLTFCLKFFPHKSLPVESVHVGIKCIPIPSTAKDEEAAPTHLYRMTGARRHHVVHELLVGLSARFTRFVCTPSAVRTTIVADLPGQPGAVAAARGFWVDVTERAVLRRTNGQSKHIRLVPVEHGAPTKDVEIVAVSRRGMPDALGLRIVVAGRRLVGSTRRAQITSSGPLHGESFPTQTLGGGRVSCTRSARTLASSMLVVMVCGRAEIGAQRMKA